MRNSLYALIVFFVFAMVLSNIQPASAAEVRRPAEWDKTLEAAKKEGKIVIAIPPANELRKDLETVLKQKFGLEAELVSAPGPRNASRIAAERKAGVSYFDALIVGTGTAVGLAHDGMLEPMEPFLILPEVKDPKEWWGGHIWEDNLSTNRYLYSFLADVSTHSIWYNSSLAKRKSSVPSMTISRPNGKIRLASATRACRAPVNRSGPLCGKSRVKTFSRNWSNKSCS
jgi:hypothetical protein